jgi:hypothetical protein
MSEDEYVYGHVLEALSGGLYPNKLDVIREYLQNSYDSIREYARSAKSEREKKKIRTESKVILTIQSGSLFIHDNALGMDFQTLNEYRKIGFSRRPFGEYAGWRGIGKAAGLAVAEKLIVTTSQGKNESYQLTFDASGMTQEVCRLRSKGKNIPFNELINRYSRINTISGGHDSFTTVELHKIRKEASELLDKSQLIAHLSMVAPVPFNPKFDYAKEIQDQLKDAIEDYTPINLFVEDVKICKPYLEKWTNTEGEATNVDKPQFVPIYDEEKESLIAFCWYCMHSEKGQIRTDVEVAGVPVSVGGLVYRLQDIKIGDAYLTRRSLWTSTPERSLWALGEVHILDERVEPTSDRNDFIDNHARYLLYRQSREVAQEVSRKASKLSEEMRARDKILEAHDRIAAISSEVASKKVSKPVVPTYIYEVTSLKREAEKRKPKTPEEELKEKADNVIRVADEVVKQLTESLSEPDPAQRIHRDIMDELKIGKEGRAIYELTLGILRDYYANEPLIFEDLVRRIDKAIQDALVS